VGLEPVSQAFEFLNTYSRFYIAQSPLIMVEITPAIMLLNIDTYRIFAYFYKSSPTTYLWRYRGGRGGIAPTHS
jgi:hypothetical protein